MRLSYPTCIRIVQVPCTGKVDVLYLLKAFQKGADGVYVAGCMEGDCHYLTGNLRARKRVEYAKKILDEIGIGGDRLEMYNMSAAAGPRFVEIANEMAERILELGPNPLKTVQTVQAAQTLEADETVEAVKTVKTAESA